MTGAPLPDALEAAPDVAGVAPGAVDGAALGGVGLEVAPELEQAAIAMEAATASAPKRRIPMVNVVPPGRGHNTGRPCAELAD